MSAGMQGSSRASAESATTRYHAYSCTRCEQIVLRQLPITTRQHTCGHCGIVGSYRPLSARTLEQLVELNGGVADPEPSPALPAAPIPNHLRAPYSCLLCGETVRGNAGRYQHLERHKRSGTAPADATLAATFAREREVVHA